MTQEKCLPHHSCDFARMCAFGLSCWKVQLIPNMLLPNLRATESISLIYRSWSIVLSSKITKRDTPLGPTPSQTIIVCGNFCFYRIPPLVSGAERLTAHDLDISRVLNFINIEHFLIGKQNFLCVFFSKVRWYPISKLYSFLFMPIIEEWLILYVIGSQS